MSLTTAKLCTTVRPMSDTQQSWASLSPNKVERQSCSTLLRVWHRPKHAVTSVSVSVCKLTLTKNTAKRKTVVIKLKALSILNNCRVFIAIVIGWNNTCIKDNRKKRACIAPWFGLVFSALRFLVRHFPIPAFSVVPLCRHCWKLRSLLRNLRCLQTMSFGAFYMTLSPITIGK